METDLSDPNIPQGSYPVSRQRGHSSGAMQLPLFSSKKDASDSFTYQILFIQTRNVPWDSK